MLPHDGTKNDILSSNDPEQKVHLYLPRNNPREQADIVLERASVRGWIQDHL